MKKLYLKRVVIVFCTIIFFHISISAQGMMKDVLNGINFVGNRIDCTYNVENGKFVLKKEEKYADKIYTYELLSDENYNLWNGNEQLLN